MEIAGSNPAGDAFLNTARYANWKSGEAQTFVTLRVRLPPVPLDTCVGWALACPGGCNPPASAVQVRLLPGALIVMAPSSTGKDTTLSRWRSGFDSRRGYWCFFSNRMRVGRCSTEPHKLGRMWFDSHTRNC